MSSVSEKALIAVRWSYLGSLARVVSQLVANIVLARILGPESFGVFAIALLLVGPVKLISELGMGSALIQIETITRESVHCVFTWLQIAGIMTTIFFLIVASYVGWLFNSPVVAEAIRYISVVFLCYPATLIASSMLQRNLNLRAIQIASVNGYAIGFLIVGIGCALMGLGALSLILAFVVQALVDCILLLVQAKPHLRLRFQKIDRSLVSYAKRVVPANLTNWILESADNFLIGKLFDAKSLGLYASVFNFVRTPTGHLVNTLQNVLFSTSSRLQHDNERLARTYIAALSAVGLVAMPVFAGIAAISETCVVAIYGSKWANAGPLLLPLALAMPLHSITAITGPILWGKGLVGQELRISLVMGIAMILVMILLSNISLTAAVWGVFAVYVLRAIWMTMTISEFCAIPVRSILHALTPGASLGFVVGGVLYFSNRQLIAIPLAPLSCLVIAIFLGIALTLTWLYFVGQRGLPDDLKLAISRLIENRPVLQRLWLRCTA